MVVEERTNILKKERKKKENMVRFQVVQYLCDVMCDDRKTSNPLFRTLSHLIWLVANHSLVIWTALYVLSHNGQNKHGGQ